MMPATKSSAKTEKTSETVTPRMATYWAFSLRRRPKIARTKKTSAGSTGMAAIISCWPTVCICPSLAPHGVDFVNVHRPARAEHGEHDRPDHQIPLERRGRRQRVQRLLHLGRDGRHYSSTPRSTPVPVLRRLTTIAATIATRSNTEATSKSKTKISDP